MIDILLIAVIVILIIAIAVLFGIKYLQNKKGKQPKPANTNKQTKIKRADPRLALSNTEEPTDLAVRTSTPQPTPTQTPPPEPKPVDELAYAEYYLRNQDYTAAIKELKRVLMTNPRHSGAMLRLLQVYGVTKQYDTFNQLHQKIHEIADNKTVQEADFCKSLIDDELAQEAAARAAKPVAKEEDTIEVLEFSTEDAENDARFEQPKPQAVSTPAPENALIEELEEEFDLDFDFDTPAKTSQPTVEPKASLNAQQDHHSTVAEPTKNTPTQTADEDFGFDLDSLDFGAPSATSAPQKSTTNDTDLDLQLGNLDLGLDSTPAKPAQATKPDSNDGLSLNGFDLDLGLDDKSAPLQTATPQPTTQEKTDTSFDELAFDFEFGSDKTTQNKPQETPNTNQASGDLAGFDSLSFDTPLDSPTTKEPVSTPTDDGLDLTLDFAAPSQPVTTTKADLDLSLGDKDTDFTPTTDTKTSSFDELSLDFADLSTQKDSPKTDDKPTFDDELPYDLSLDTTKQDLTPNDELSLDGSSLPQPSKDKGTDDDFGSLSLDFAQDKPTQEATKTDALTFDLTNDTFTPPTPSVSAQSSSVADTAFDFGELSLVDNDKIKPQPEKQTAQTITIETVTQSVISPTEPVEPVEIAKTSTQDDTTGLDFDFGFDEKSATNSEMVAESQTPASNQTPTLDEATLDLGDLSASKDDMASADSAQSDSPLAQMMDVITPDAVESPAAKDTATTIKVATSPAVAVPAHSPTDDELFGDSLDNAQITLNLAKQYLAFGEYTSAKHLLGEVLQTGNDSQKQNAQTLISRLS